MNPWPTGTFATTRRTPRCNRQKINHWTLGIEIVNTQSASDAFSPWQTSMTAQIVRYCWAKYPNLKYVFSHALVDPTRRSNPGRHFDWETFTRQIVSSANDPVTDPVNMTLTAKLNGPLSVAAIRPGASCCM
ncbi:hypothetical protein [Arvimicrobium flavum]|uniref:hypothetical protein n=1 Tax=Arvimicrobium flavum TaxID=3393320 RepID=UPI00398D3D13